MNFEFMVLPSFLYLVKGEEEWGGLWVYTCEESCGREGEEFLWVEECED